MTRRIDSFIDEIRSAAEFVAAARTNPAWSGKLEQFAEIFDRLALDDDPVAIMASDEINSICARRDLSLNRRFFEVLAVLKWRRDAIRVVH